MGDFFSYFQLAALAVFLLVFVGRSVYLRLAKGINPFALGVRKGGLRFLVEAAFPIALAMWSLEILASALGLGWRVFPGALQARLIDSAPAKFVGAMLITSGVVVFTLALVSFGTSWRVGIDEKAPGALVTTGMFALSRNPIFVFLNLSAWGTFLINGTLGFLIFAALLSCGIHYQILQEEEFLKRTYGRSYGEYCGRTARYLGWRARRRTG